jgi:quercetin dioxygenase-like cupin family protein
MARMFIAILGGVTLLLPSLSTKADEVPDAMSVEWQGKKPCENLYEDSQIRILRCTFAPGAVHVRHSHPATFNYALSGGKVQLQNETGTSQREISSDSYVSSPPVAWHEATNVGDTTLRVLVVEKKY